MPSISIRTQPAFFIANANSTPEINGVSLRAAIAAAKASTPGGNPLSTTNRALVLVPQGEYNIVAGGDLTLDTNYVDIIGLAGSVRLSGSTIISSVPTIIIDDHIHFSSIIDIKLEKLKFKAIAGHFVSDDAIWQVNSSSFANCSFEDITWLDSSGGSNLRAIDISSAGGAVSGSWENCHTACPGFLDSRGADSIEVSGTFVDCSAGNGSFAGRSGGSNGVSTTFSGKATKCKSGTYSFAGSDTYDADLGILYIDAHYVVDRVGSVQEATD